jgi:hypothetical protein
VSNAMNSAFIMLSLINLNCASKFSEVISMFRLLKLGVNMGVRGEVDRVSSS